MIKKIKLSCHKTGLAVGLFCAIVHLAWAIAVGLGFGQLIADLFFGMHFLYPIMTVLPFNFLTALILTATAFVFGYLFGALFAWLWNLL